MKQQLLKIKQIKNKLKNKHGESITETLVSVLIIALAMTMLAGSIVAATKVNTQVKNSNVSFQKDNVNSSTGTVTISGKSGSIPVNIYTTNDKNSYVYYEK